MRTKWLPGSSLHSQVSFFLFFQTNYFVLVTVNMILINMMMAIINMAFEDIKNQSDAYQNKFEIMEYVKRSTRELTGVA